MITLLVTRGWGVQEKYCTILSVTRGRVVQDILYKFICHQKLGRYKKYDTTLSVTRGWEVQEKYCTISFVTRGRLVQDILYKFICHQKLGRYKKYDTTLSVQEAGECKRRIVQFHLSILKPARYKKTMHFNLAQELPTV